MHLRGNCRFFSAQGETAEQADPKNDRPSFGWKLSGNSSGRVCGFSGGEQPVEVSLCASGGGKSPSGGKRTDSEGHFRSFPPECHSCVQHSPVFSASGGMAGEQRTEDRREEGGVRISGGHKRADPYPGFFHGRAGKAFQDGDGTDPCGAKETAGGTLVPLS